MKTSIHSVFLLASFVLIFSSCKRDQPVTPVNNGTAVTPGMGAFVVDEGNYLGGNAKISFFKFSDASVTEDMFQPINIRPLGDVGQSMTLINGKEYIVVNNSGKIEVVNPSNCFATNTITGFTSPRYILPVSATKAYVSDLFANAISIVNLSSNTRSGSVPFPAESEAMVMANGEVFVSSTSSDKVYVMNPNTDAVTDSIAVAKGGNSMVIDNNGKLWVLCYGDYFTSAAGGLFRINTSTHLVEQSFPFTTAESPTRLCSNTTGDTLYYLDYGVMRMASNAVTLPASAFIPQSTQNFYGLGIRPNGEIFVADAVDFSQRGHLLQYAPSGTLLNNVTVGVIPGTIYFY
jgi:YVTN family beta-propeller protein